jgi:hypothetical protein
MNRGLRVGVLLFLSCFTWACTQQPKRSPAVELADEAVRRGREANHKYLTGDYQTAKSALLDLLAFLDKAGYPPNAPDMYRVDAMSTCVRLAKLEEKQGHEAEKDSFMKEALARCQTLRFTNNCNEGYLRKETDRLDTMIK